MYNKNIRIFKYSRLILITSFVIICIALFVQFWFIMADNKKTLTADINENNAVYLAVKGAGPESDMWPTVIQQSADPEDVKDYTGVTCSISVENKQPFDLTDWTFRLDIQDECYLNGFWCGRFEVHQFRDGVETVGIVEQKNNDLEALGLDYNEYSSDMMIRLLPGDYLVYLPSAEQNETVVKKDRNVGVGAIFYFSDTLRLDQIALSYHNNRHIYNGRFFIITCAVLLVWALFHTTYLASKFTYERTKRTVESISHAVITGLSREYKTIWLVHVKEKTIQLIKNLEDDEVNQALIVSKKYEDYNVALKFYVEHYVDESERNLVWESVEFESVKKRLESENFFSVNYLHHFSDEESGMFQMAFTKVADGKNGYNIVLAYRDINQIVLEEQARQQQLENALKEAERANRSKSMFLASMSHEIRTPINAILGMDTMILREAKDTPIREYAKNIKGASNTLLSLINDILDFSKIESGEMELIPDRYQLNHVINDLNTMIRGKIEEKGLAFELDLNPDTPSQLIGDEVRLKQIVINILNNATKYTKQGTITWKLDYEIVKENICRLKIAIRDTGIGIKEEDLSVICSPYKRVDGSTNHYIEGTGLGLNITKNLIEKMGGELQVSSVYGEGSEFSFAIDQEMWGSEPIGSERSVEATEEETAETFHAPQARILVVDDVEMNLMVIRNLLKRVEISPDTVLSGSEALELTNQNLYDIIFLDAMMPQLSGEETLQKIRQSEGINRDTPVIVLTANAIIGAKEEYIRQGFHDYLSKPVSGEALENMIRKYLPEDKIVKVSVDSADENCNDEYESMLQAIRQIPELHVEEGIQAAGGMETYLNVCKNFCETTQTRVKLLQDSREQEQFSEFTIQAHALKSSARLIGAAQLSEQALRLELAGKEGRVEEIRENAQELIEAYARISEKLRTAMAESDTAEELPKTELPGEKLERMLGELEELLEAFDYETARELFDSLEQYRMPEEFASCYEKLKVYMAEVDYDGMHQVLEAYMHRKDEE